ncbi:hypothetical protein B4U80_09456 [Leptotrombidium deliense]|uniref:Flavin-containing monooxygenase n=1 Tax=Leptotrombidium deliense TaxID=299467 RepID=A0A443SAZ8_9ACAR|nr:hypothetical protein B4U80_09456 [Leptotrombidium deliense]
MFKRKHICVIGAGSSGLTAVKQCLDQDLDVVCFEKTDNLGGLWRYREDDIDGVASVAKTTVINTSKEMSAFSDFIPPNDFPNYMDHKHMCKYFELYAQHYDLLRYIRYNHNVLKVALNDDYDETGKLKVILQNKDENKTFDQVFDGVMVCVGHHVKPNIPTFPGQETFKGKILHTHSYKTSTGFEDKVAVVVGIGNSGGDVAVDLSYVCSQVYLVTRSGCWITHRVNLKGQPVDLIFGTRFVKRIFSLFSYNTVCSFLEYYANTFFNHELYGLKPKHRIYGQHPTVNDSISKYIISGKILVRKNIERFTENGVVFAGMDAETKCDVVVLATGYEISFPFIDSSIIPVINNKVRLFRNTFQADLKHPHTLAIIGLIQPNGAIFPIAEMQSRWFTLLMKGERKLPNKQEMSKIIEQDIKAIESRFYGSHRHTIQVNYIAFMDLIASYVGCKPNLFHYALTDRKLWFQLLFGPCMPYQYRLTGPNNSFQNIKTQRKIICVVGAGSSGLTATKQCLDQYLDVVCFEKTDNLGGLWRYREDDIEGVASVAKTTIINTSKELSAFSDFVPPKEFSNYMDHSHMLKYFEMYAQHYDLLRYIRYNHNVLKVALNDDYDETGKLKVTLQNKDENKTFDQVFDGVMVCVGHHVKPQTPSFPDQELFEGKIIHTHSYKTTKDFEDKVAVVVGIGNSGGDIAVDLSHVCSQVYMVTRSGTWINHRVNLKGQPVDLLTNTRLMNFITSVLPYNVVCSYFEYYVNTFFDHDLYGLKPKHRILGQHPMANDLISKYIISGKILIRKNIERFTKNGVVFEGMDKETKCDVVVFATGYEISFPFIDSSVIPVVNNKVQLFKNTFQPNLKHPYTLAIIGLIQPIGAIFPIAEMQSRWFALLMKGKRKLPKKEEMLRIMDEDMKAIEKRYYSSGRHTIQVDFIPFMDLIATYVGCKPNLFRYAITDHKLWFQLLFGPCMPYQYRLTGPNQWDGARDAILNYKERYQAPFKK